MRTPKLLAWSARIALCLLPLLVAVAAAGCAGADGGRSKTAAYKAGDMPEGADWNGVYFHQIYGFLHVVKTGDTVAAKWRRTDQSRWGELHGKVLGNLLRFDWTEHKVGLVGPGSTSSGKGYFLYKRPPGENVDDELNGEWGLGQDETGNSWAPCKKQRNMNPDLASIGPPPESGSTVGEWK